MKLILQALVAFAACSSNAWAASTQASTGMFKMVTGLAIVLAVMAIVAWVIKRFLPNMSQHQQSAMRVVSSVSVGARERVVVLQVADRWIVVGVAPGQVNGIANLEIDPQQLQEGKPTASISQSPTAPQLSAFAGWLQQASAKIIQQKSPK